MARAMLARDWLCGWRLRKESVRPLSPASKDIIQSEDYARPLSENIDSEQGLMILPPPKPRNKSNPWEEPDEHPANEESVLLPQPWTHQAGAARHIAVADSPGPAPVGSVPSPSKHAAPHREPPPAAPEWLPEEGLGDARLPDGASLHNSDSPGPNSPPRPSQSPPATPQAHQPQFPWSQASPQVPSNGRGEETRGPNAQGLENAPRGSHQHSQVAKHAHVSAMRAGDPEAESPSPALGSPERLAAHEEPPPTLRTSAAGSPAKSQKPHEEVPGYALVVGQAVRLGMDPMEDFDLLWIAEQACTAPLPPEWDELTDAQGAVFYSNVDTGESQWSHPSEDQYRKLFLWHKQQGAQLKQEMQKAGSGGAGSTATSDESDGDEEQPPKLGGAPAPMEGGDLARPRRARRVHPASLPASAGSPSSQPILALPPPGVSGGTSESSGDEHSGVSEDDDIDHGSAADKVEGTSGAAKKKGVSANLGGGDPPSPDARAAALRPTSARPPARAAGKSFMEQLVEAMEGVNKHLDSSTAARHNLLTLEEEAEFDAGGAPALNPPLPPPGSRRRPLSAQQCSRRGAAAKAAAASRPASAFLPPSLPPQAAAPPSAPPPFPFSRPGTAQSRASLHTGPQGPYPGSRPTSAWGGLPQLYPPSGRSAWEQGPPQYPPHNYYMPMPPHMRVLPPPPLPNSSQPPTIRGGPRRPPSSQYRPSSAMSETSYTGADPRCAPLNSAQMTETLVQLTSTMNQMNATLNQISRAQGLGIPATKGGGMPSTILSKQEERQTCISNDTHHEENDESESLF